MITRFTLAQITFLVMEAQRLIIFFLMDIFWSSAEVHLGTGQLDLNPLPFPFFEGRKSMLIPSNTSPLMSKTLQFLPFP